MDENIIFVYGSLRKDLLISKHSMMAGQCEFIANGSIQARLYEVDGYPGAIRSSSNSDRVRGELYRLRDSEIFAILDKYEHCSEEFPRPHEYVRESIQATLCYGGNVQAWVYFYNRDTSRLQRIHSGDYTEHTMISQR